MVEAADAYFERRPHQLDRAHHIGLEEGFRLDDRAAVVGLGGKVDDRVHGLTAKGRQGHVVVAYVAVHEGVAVAVLFHVVQARRVGGVGEQVVVHDTVVRVVGEPVADEIRADETGTAGDEDRGHAAFGFGVRKAHST